MPNFDNISDSFFDDLFGFPKKKKEIEKSPEKQVEMTNVKVNGQEIKDDHELHFKKADSSFQDCISSNILIESYQIERIKIPFNFYQAFFYDAKKYYYVEIDKEVPFVDFYSYRPQYSQLSNSQLKYYFYWRSMLRKGEYIRTSDSYIDLYLNEILNVTNVLIKPQIGMIHICNLLNQYYLKKISIGYNQIIRFIVDYSLVFQTDIPMDKLLNVKSILFVAENYKEFFIGSYHNASEENISDLIHVYSEYDYLQSKFITKDNQIAVKKHMETAMILCFNEFFSQLKEKKQGIEKRELYCFSSQIYNDDCKIHAHLNMANLSNYTEDSITYLITNCVRYIENWLRKLSKMNSRLTLKKIPDSYIHLINHYFESKQNKPVEQLIKKPEYEKLYDAESEGINFVLADEIEKVSWDNTAKLVVEEEVDREELEEKIEETHTFPISISAFNYLTNIVKKLDMDLALSEMDSLASEINNYFQESDLSDIVLEPTGMGYKLISDYETEVKEWLNQNSMK